MRILICDKDHDFTRHAAGYLSGCGHGVDCVENSSAVFESLEARPYDLLLCDAWCSPLAPLAVGRKIRQNPRPEIRNMPVVILVMEAPTHEMFKSFREENIHCLIKYRSPSHWIEKISTLLEKETA